MYSKKTHIHFVGIGGIGMSGIATILKMQGYHVSGCDVDIDQKSTASLKEMGCPLYPGNNAPGCFDESIDVMVYSTMIQPHSAEIEAAQQRGTPTIHRSVMLAELMRKKYSVAVAGAHGKTTTTSLISHILIEAHTDPTVVIGGHLKNIASNARCGNGNYIVAEADESDRSFLRLRPSLAVITNINLEHLDVYTSLDDIKETFKSFLDTLPFYGKAVVCNDNDHVREVVSSHNVKTITYGIQHDADFFARDITLLEESSLYTVYYKNVMLGHVTLSMPGIHNVSNSLAAIALCMELGVSFAVCAEALHSFQGIDRRFTHKGIFQGAELFDDYGHHPTEIHHTLLVARKRAKKNLIVVFQPHRYTRTYHLWNNFLTLFKEHSHAIDHLIITDIYSAHEKPIDGITAGTLVKKIKEECPRLSVVYVPFSSTMDRIKKELEATAHEEDLVLLQGAGTLHKLPALLQEHLP